jgi:hypothetical protein
MKRARPLVRCVSALLLSVALVLCGPSTATADSDRIVAIGDVHGSLDSLVTILESAGLIDDDRQWIGGSASLVQTGDLMDRGRRLREVLDLVMSLEDQAPAAGGRVVALLGNHEVNNLVGYFDPDSTSPDAFTEVVGAFADDQSEKRRRQAVPVWRAWQKRYPQCSTDSKREWMAAHPLGFLEFMEAIGPSGHYGRWLRERDVVHRIGDTIFVHGGLSPEPPAAWPSDTLDQINRQIRLEIERFDADRAFLEEQEIALPFSTLGELFCALSYEIAILGLEETEANLEAGRRLEEIRDRLPSGDNWLAFHADGPLWFRGYANWSDDEGPAAIAKVVAAYGVERFVVGHTPQTEGIRARFDNRVFLIDTAMVFGAAAGGVAAALEFDGDEQVAIYENTRGDLRAPQIQEADAPALAASQTTAWIGPDGEPLPFTTPQEVLDFLRTAEVESIQDIPVGVTQPKRLLLAKGALRSKAVFRYVDITEQRRRLSTGKFVMFFRDNYMNEVAAYELSRLLKMDKIPPAVPRNVDGQDGSVQMWVENTMMETERRDQEIAVPDRLRFRRQFYDMRVFDNLINNTDRNSGNILIDDDWKLWLIDHTRSFARGKELPAPQEVQGCSRPLFEAIKALDDDVVTERLRPYLPAAEVKALLERRRRLIALLEERFAQRGEHMVLFNYGDPDNNIRIVTTEAEE